MYSTILTLIPLEGMATTPASAILLYLTGGHVHLFSRLQNIFDLSSMSLCFGFENSAHCASESS